MSNTQFGVDINTNSGNNSIDINCIGNVMAVGIPDSDLVRVYHNTGGSWSQMGSDIEPPDPNRNSVWGDKFGYDVSLNGTGNILAVSDRGWLSNCGRVAFYSYNNGWTNTDQLMGNLIANVNSNANFGESVSLNTAGNVIVIGATGTSSYTGEARIFANDGTDWEQLGGTITGTDSSDYFGGSVDINSSGNTVAISSTTHDEWKGHVRVFERNPSNTADPTGWEQVGSDIDGNASHQGFGQCVSLNNAGNVIAITGANRSGSSGWYTGVTRVYHRDNGNTIAPTGWEQLGEDIEGETTFNYSDFDTDLNYNGNLLVIGANKGNVVRVFKRESGNTIAPNGWEQVGSNIYGDTGDEFGYNVCLNSSGNVFAGISSSNNGTVRTYSIGTDEEFNCDPSVTGDPYITTISGITYKMDDFTGYIRLIQGTLNDKLFTINAETKLLSSDETYELINWKDKNNIYNNFTEGSEFTNFPAYLSKLYVCYGKESFIIDINTQELISANYAVNIARTYCMTNEYTWSEKKSVASIAEVSFNNITIVIKTYQNKDIRNGFVIKNSFHIKNGLGAIISPMHTNDIKLPTIDSISYIGPKNDYISHKLSIEEFISGENNKKTIILPIF